MRRFLLSLIIYMWGSIEKITPPVGELCFLGGLVKGIGGALGGIVGGLGSVARTLAPTALSMMPGIGGIAGRLMGGAIAGRPKAPPTPSYALPTPSYAPPPVYAAAPILAEPPWYKKPLFWGILGGSVALILILILIFKR